MSNKRKKGSTNAHQSIHKENEKKSTPESDSVKVYKVEIVSMPEEKKMQLADKIQIIIAALTFVSVILVFLTLQENRITRNMTYKPFIVMNPINISVKWDSNGFSTWLTENSNVGTPGSVDADDSEINMKIPMSFLEEDTVTKYTVENIGVGTARDITFSWDNNNLSRLNNYLISVNKKYENFFKEGEKQDSFQIGDSLLFTNKIHDSAMMYMLSQADEPWTLYFPVQYRILIEELIKQDTFEAKDFPLVILKIDYMDIQEKKHTQFIAVRVNRMKFVENEDGSGEAMYQLTPVNSRKS